MITNSECIIYHRAYDPATRGTSWTKTVVDECWWFKDSKSVITTNGFEVQDTTTVRIPDTSHSIAKGDYLLKGSDGPAITTAKDLVGAGEYFEVLGANYNLFGDNPHIKVVG